MKRRVVRINNLKNGIRRIKFVPESNIFVVRTEDNSPVVVSYSSSNKIMKIEFEDGPVLQLQDAITIQERGRLRILNIQEIAKDKGIRQFAIHFLKSDPDGQ
tara:strand:- start:926 stop:1231 length:306 start_codon:yes stop_codon:yes gene_type:complete